MLFLGFDPYFDPLADDSTPYVPLHSVRTIALHLIRHVTVYVQGKGRRSVAPVALDCFYIVPVLQGNRPNA